MTSTWRLALVGMACCFGCAGTAVRAAGSAWHEARTARFSVMTDGDPEQARMLARDLERFHRVMLRTTSFEEREAAPPLRVFLTSNHGEYVALGGPEISTGVFKSSIRGNFALVALGTRVCRNRTGSHVRCRSNAVTSDAARAVLFHEYVHNIEAQAGSRSPSWYAEGLAEYMGATEFREDGSYTLGCPRPERMAWMRHHDWVPMDELMKAEVIATIPGQYTNTYGQAWAAVHYFSADEARTKQLAHYLALWAAGTEYDRAVEQAFGMTSGELDRLVNEYALQTRFECLSASNLPGVVPEPAVRPLISGEAHFRIAELVFSSFGPSDAVFDLLAEGLRAAPHDARILAALARAHWARATDTNEDDDASDDNGAPDLSSQDVKQGLAYLKRALQLTSPASAPYVAVVEGHILTRQAATQLANGEPRGSETLSQARKAYRRAIKADESLAEAYAGLGETYRVQDNGSKEPIVALEAASYLLPRSAQAPLTLARIRMARGQYAEAEAPLRYVMSLGAHSGVFATAKQLLERARTTQSQAAR